MVSNDAWTRSYGLLCDFHLGRHEIEQDDAISSLPLYLTLARCLFATSSATERRRSLLRWKHREARRQQRQKPANWWLSPSEASRLVTSADQKLEQESRYVHPEKGRWEIKGMPTGFTTDVVTHDELAPQGRRCCGCGSSVQSVDYTKQGYVPKSVADTFRAGRKKVYNTPRGVMIDEADHGSAPGEVIKVESGKYKMKTRLIYCQRCFVLQQYHRLPDPKQEEDRLRRREIDEGPPVAEEGDEEGELEEDSIQVEPLQELTADELAEVSKQTSMGYYRMKGGYQWQQEEEIVAKVVKSIRKDSLVLMLVDILDFESSIVPELFESCRQKNLQVMFVINKIDGIPFYEKKKHQIRQWATRMSRQIKNSHWSDVVLVSSLNGTGFADLEERMRQYLSSDKPRWIYIVGRVNTGKSTFVNRWLRHIGYTHLGTVNYKRGTGGITRSPVPGTTMQFVTFGLPRKFRLVDSPGIPSKAQLTSFLEDPKDLYDLSLCRQHPVRPVTHTIKPGRSLIIGGGLARIDHKGASTQGMHAQPIFLSCFLSNKITLHVIDTKKADDFLARKKGAFMYPPHSPDAQLPPLTKHNVEVYAPNPHTAMDDISIAGLGWITVYGYGHEELTVWVPEGVKVFRRPAVLPYTIRQKGVSEFHPRARGRGQKIAREKFKEVRDKNQRDKWRSEAAAREASFISPSESAPSKDVPFVEEATVNADAV
ncbi:nitric oxide associated protein 1 [Perkinsus olseni]|uniref:Nitric oxide associated protein 1 n=1 Tax=Perkinsus olseni TaxID=32597 RepID=A0A7J6KW98_PEROL|nr:nitric oxide associated protein 1 [Perkinsus olseni]